MSRWREWAESRHSDEDSMGEVASVELIELSDKELAYWVQCFITEVHETGLLQVIYMHSLKLCITFTVVCFWLIKVIEF